MRSMSTMMNSISMILIEEIDEEKCDDQEDDNRLMRTRTRMTTSTMKI